MMERDSTMQPKQKKKTKQNKNDQKKKKQQTNKPKKTKQNSGISYKAVRLSQKLFADFFFIILEVGNRQGRRKHRALQQNAMNRSAFRTALTRHIAVKLIFISDWTLRHTQPKTRVVELHKPVWHGDEDLAHWPHKRFFLSMIPTLKRGWLDPSLVMFLDKNSADTSCDQWTIWTRDNVNYMFEQKKNVLKKELFSSWETQMCLLSVETANDAVGMVRKMLRIMWPKKSSGTFFFSDANGCSKSQRGSLYKCFIELLLHRIIHLIYSIPW